MKPRTVILTLELPACEMPLAGFRKARCVGLWDGDRKPIYHVLDVAQATVSVAQQSGARARARAKLKAGVIADLEAAQRKPKAPKRKGSRR